MAAGSGDDIDLVVTLRDRLSKPAKQVEQRIDAIGDEADEAARKIAKMEAAMAASGDTAVSSGKQFRKGANDFDAGGNAAAKAARSMQTLNRSLDGFKNRLRNIGGAGGGMFSGFFTSLNMYKVLFTDMGAAIPPLLQGITSLGAAAVALVGPMARVASAAGLAVPAYIALGQALVVGRMGFKGIGEAIKVLGDGDATAEQIAEVMKDLGPNAQAFARGLVAIQPRLTELRKGVQETFLDGLLTPVQKLTDNYLPRLASSLGRTAVSMRGGITYFSDLFTKPQNVEHVVGLMDQNATNIGHMARMGSNFALTLTKFAAGAAPELGRVLGNWERSSLAFANNMDVEAIATSMEKASRSAGKFWEGLKLAGRGLSNLSAAAKPLSTFLVTGLMGNLGKFATWSESEDGMAKMTSFFEGQIPNLQAIGSAFGALWDGMGKLSSSPNFAIFMNMLADTGIPALIDLIDNLDKDVTGPLTRFGEAFAQIDINGIFKPLGDILTIMANATETLAPALERLPGPFKDMAGYLAGMKLIGAFPLLGAMFAGGGRIGGGGIAGGFGGKPGFGGIGTALGGTKVYWSGAPLVTVVGGAGGVGGAAGGKGGNKGGVGGKGGRLGGLGFRGMGMGGMIGTMLGLGALSSTFGQGGQVGVGAGMGSGALTGASLGMTFGPWGALIGGLTGGLVGGIAAQETNRLSPKEAADVRNKAKDHYETAKKEYESLQKTNPIQGPIATPSLSASMHPDNTTLYGRVNQPNAFDRAAKAQQAVKPRSTYQGITSPSAPDVAQNQWRQSKPPPDVAASIEAVRQKTESTKLSFANLGNTARTNTNPALQNVPKNPFAGTNASAFEANGKVSALKSNLDRIPASKNTSVKVTVDDTLWRNWQPGRKTGTVSVTVTSPSAPTGAYGSNYGRYAGGPVWTGQEFRVGERGPEAYVGSNGQMEIVGKNGGEFRKFDADGYIVPNHALEAALAGVKGTMGTRAGSGDSGAAERLPDVSVTVLGNVTKDVDIRGEVRKAIVDVQRRMKERG